MQENTNWYNQHQLVPVKVTGNKSLQKNVYITSFEKKFDFIPGQVIAVTTDLSLPPRMYSLAGGVKDDSLSILYDVKEDGLLTPALANLKEGHLVFITKPYGSFTDAGSPSVWIAAGTGLAPFLSMILSDPDSQHILIHGSREISGFWFSQLLNELMGKRYIRCCSGETGRDIFAGRVTQYLDQWKELPSDRFYYLCGKAEMVVDVRQQLLKREISFNQIMAEIYF